MKLPDWTNHNLIAGLFWTAITFIAFSLASQIPWWVTISVIIFAILVILFLGFWPAIWGRTKDSLGGVWSLFISLGKFIAHPFIRLIFFIIFLIGAIFISAVPTRYYLAIGALFLYIYAQGFLRRKPFASPTKLLFSDTFENLENWDIRTGNPVVKYDFGNPSPDVLLSKNSNDRTHSFISIKEIENLSNGSVECDVYLEPDSLVNIAFRANFDQERYYMARLDSRNGYSDSILRLDGKDKNWREIAISNQRSEPKKWHRVKVVFKKEEIRLYKNDNLIVSTRDATYSGGGIGVFNEVESVHVDNFVVRKEL